MDGTSRAPSRPTAALSAIGEKRTVERRGEAHSKGAETGAFPCGDNAASRVPSRPADYLSAGVEKLERRGDVHSRDAADKRLYQGAPPLSSGGLPDNDLHGAKKVGVFPFGVTSPGAAATGKGPCAGTPSTPFDDDFFSRSARLFAPSLSTAPTRGPRITLEAWLASTRAKGKEAESTPALALAKKNVAVALAPQFGCGSSGWQPMGCGDVGSGWQPMGGGDDFGGSTSPGAAAADKRPRAATFNNADGDLFGRSARLFAPSLTPTPTRGTYIKPEASTRAMEDKFAPQSSGGGAAMEEQGTAGFKQQQLRQATPRRQPQSACGKGSVATKERLYKQGDPKTELCRYWTRNGACLNGARCLFAHGHGELLPVAHHPRHQTRVCEYVKSGLSCPFAHRCHFRH